MTPIIVLFLLPFSIVPCDAFQATRSNRIPMSVIAVSATEDAAALTGRDLLSNHGHVDHLMQSEAFLSSLHDPDFADLPHRAHPPVDTKSFYDADIELQMLSDRKSLDALLQSLEYRSSLKSEETKAEDGFFGKKEIHQHSALAHLMESDEFKHSLDVSDSPSEPFHATHNTIVDSDTDFDISSDFSKSMLHQKAELDNLMKDDIRRRGDESSAMDFLIQQCALYDVLRSSVFRSSLHPNNEGEHLLHPHSNMADSHLHTLLVGEEDNNLPATDFDFDLAMLRGKSSLNRLLSTSPSI
jgi:hypothetical protein